MMAIVIVLWMRTGRVTKGMGVVRQIEAVKTDKQDQPVEAVRIESVSVHAK